MMLDAASVSVCFVDCMLRAMMWRKTRKTRRLEIEIEKESTGADDAWCCFRARLLCGLHAAKRRKGEKENSASNRRGIMEINRRKQCRFRSSASSFVAWYALQMGASTHCSSISSGVVT